MLAFDPLESVSQETSLGDSVMELMDWVCRDEKTESAWLSALSHMEALAAQQIRGNVSASTPETHRQEIIEHAADEDRHSAMLQAMRPIPKFLDPCLLKLEGRLRGITENFVVGYFGNPLLVNARNRHEAYVHGALTIEQFPFQIYSTYIKRTSLPRVRRELPIVLADEQDHLDLGSRMLQEIPDDARLSIAALTSIERDMCQRMVRRCRRAVQDYLREEPETPSWVKRLGTVPEAVVAWGQTLSFAEKRAALAMQTVFPDGQGAPAGFDEHVADELRHSALLQRAVLLERFQLRRKARYARLESAFLKAMESYLSRLLKAATVEGDTPSLNHFYASLPLETRVFRHYSELINSTDHILLGHVLGTILEEEGAHVQNARLALNKTPGSRPEALARISRFEKSLFDRLGRQVERALEDYGAGAVS